MIPAARQLVLRPILKLFFGRGEDVLLGEQAMLEAYQLRKRFHGNDLTHPEVLKCFLPLIRAHLRKPDRQRQVLQGTLYSALCLFCPDIGSGHQYAGACGR